jgi:hypothetical protein
MSTLNQQQELKFDQKGWEKVVCERTVDEIWIR